MASKAFFDARTYTLTYLVWDEATRDAAVIDPVLDYDVGGATTHTESVEALSAFIAKNDLRVRALLETHAHADHLSGAQILKERFPGAVLAIGENITRVQRTFKEVFALPDHFPTDGRQFDHLLADGEDFTAGSLTIHVLATPGHTPACSSYRIGDAVFTGDALFMPDYGVGRCDFPDADARALYRSVVERLYRLPPQTRIFVGHDYQPGGRELRYESTVAEQRRANVQLHEGICEEDFVRFRTARDATLSAPLLLFPSVQVNINAGRLPEPEANGIAYLKIPLNRFGKGRGG